MSSSPVAINRIVISGRAVTDPIKKTVNTHRGEATLSTFAIRTAKDTHVGSVIMEIQAWERTAGQTDHVKKGRTVAVDGQLTQHEFLGPDGRRQTEQRFAPTASNCSTPCPSRSPTDPMTTRRSPTSPDRRASSYRFLGRSTGTARHACGATSHSKQTVTVRATATVTLVSLFLL